jgi:hypothetical protein
MNRRVLPFGIAVELLTSLLLWGLAPTDGVRVWYPSVWAYMGEHGLVWGVLISILFVTLLACFVSELVATLYVWFLIPLEGGTSRAWYTGRFADNFRMRLATWCVLAASASLTYWLRYKRIPKRTQVLG